MDSAICERQELPVHRTNTVLRSLMLPAPSCCLRHSFRVFIRRLGFARWRGADALRALATAVSGQICQQRVHGRKIRRIDELATESSLGDELRTKQVLQMKRQR